jgi:hypothetical protein
MSIWRGYAATAAAQVALLEQSLLALLHLTMCAHHACSVYAACYGRGDNALARAASARRLKH